MQVQSRSYVFVAMLALAGGCAGEDAAGLAPQGAAPSEAGLPEPGATASSPQPARSATAATVEGAALLGRGWEHVPNPVGVSRSLPIEGARAEGSRTWIADVPSSHATHALCH